MNALINSFVSPILPYVAGKTSGKSGYRVAAIKFKTDKLTKIKRESVYAEIPVIDKDSIVSNVTVLVDAIRGWCEDAQDVLLREAVLAGKTEFTGADCNLEAIAAYMREQQVSGRLTGEAVDNWYVENMETPLMLVLSQHMGVDENSPLAKQKQLEQVAEVYKTNIVSLASGRTKHSKDIAVKLLRAFELCELTEESCDEIGCKLLGRLKVMSQSDDAVQLLAL